MAEKAIKRGFIVEFEEADLEQLNELSDLDGRSRKKYVENIVKNHLKKINSALKQLTNGK